MSHDFASLLCCPEHIFWVVEQNSLLLINRKKFEQKRLFYPEAVVWDLMSRNISRKHLVNMLSVITEFSSEDAESLLDDCVGHWTETGWLVEKEKG